MNEAEGPDEVAAPAPHSFPAFRIPGAATVLLGLAVLSVCSYAAVQRGPLRAIDCFLADDFFVDVDEPVLTLDKLRSEAKKDTRNCVTVRVTSGPSDGDAIVSLSRPSKWIFYRGDYTLEVTTVPGDR